MQLSRRSALKKGGLAAASLLSAPFFLRRAAAESLASGAAGAEASLFSIREIYCPAHFGNSYEVMWPGEMKVYLAEMKWWGFNRYSDWIATTDVRNPYASVGAADMDLATEQLNRKKKAFHAAQELGLDLNLILTPNDVYLDQLHPNIAATKGKKIFGQLVCPSNPAGRKIILANAESWFRDLAADGLQFKTWTAFAYDYGGCGCPKCKPWILTFARLTKEIQTIAQKYHPRIEPWYCSWWWTPEEHALINDWAKNEAPDWLKGMTLHLPYERTRFQDVEVPAGCRKLAFVHISYADTAKFRDIYGKWGPTIAPQRIPKTLHDIAALKADGFQAYSEGVFDDANKALLAGIGSGKFSDANAVLKAYAERYFGAKGEKAEQWAHWLTPWGVRKNVKLPGAQEEFDKLAQGVSSSWRLEQWRSKLKLERIDRAIGVPKENAWTSEKLKLVDEFWAAQEQLQRDVYKLGTQPHIFARQFNPPDWYDGWQRATKAAPKRKMLEPEA